MAIDPLQLTRELIERESVTPADAGCQVRITELLSAVGFHCEALRIGDVENLIAWHGDGEPGLAFLGHTDVVPPGPRGQWSSPPFRPSERNGRLYGRGAADMKGSVAAMTCALAQFVADSPGHRGRVALILTSDEEGPAIDGIRKVAPWLREQRFPLDYCLVGEPSSDQRLGDRLRVGRRGSLNIAFTLRGKQGHAAYPQLATNPIHAGLAPLAELAMRTWDTGDDAFPPTSFQITDLHGGEGVFNVIPGELRGKCNFRYSPRWQPDELEKMVRESLDRTAIDYDLDAQDSGRPFYTPPGRLRTAAVSACRDVLAVEPQCDTGGGTSDGRFIAPLGVEVVELGPINASIHKIDEWIDLDAPDRLRDVYRNIIDRLLR